LSMTRLAGNACRSYWFDNFLVITSNSPEVLSVFVYNLNNDS
jgi:hypothetical protein